MKIIKIIFLRRLFAGAFLCGYVSASWATTTGPYLGLQLGWGRLNQGEFIAGHLNRLVSRVLPDTSFNNIFFNDTGRGGRLFVGYQFNQYFALELGYYQFSTLNFNAALNTDIPIYEDEDVNIHLPLELSTKVQVKTDAFDLTAKGIFPFTDYFSVYGKVGVVALNSEGTAVITAKTPLVDVSLYTGPTVNMIYPIFGVGINYDATKRLSLDLSVIRIQQINPNLYPNIDFASVGILYRFH